MWTKHSENKSEQTRGRNWVRSFPTQELLDADGGFRGCSKTSLREKEARGPEFGSVLIIAITANIQRRQKPGRQAASLPLLCLWSYPALQVKVSQDRIWSWNWGAAWEHLLSWNCGKQTSGCRSTQVRRSKNRHDGLRNPFVVFEPEIMGCLRAWLRPYWSINAPVLLNLPRGSDMNTEWQWQ